MAIEVQSPSAPLPPPSPPTTLSDDERWNLWRAKGVAHDRIVRRRMMIALTVLGIGGVLLSYVFLGR